MAHYGSSIRRVRFRLAGDRDILLSSSAPITSGELFRNNVPVEGGIYDARLGTTDHSYSCQTCSNSKKYCFGHDGHIDLNYPVINPMALEDMRKWIKLICHECGMAVIPESTWAAEPKAKKLSFASQVARTGTRKCIHCSAAHPQVKKDPKEQLGLIAEWFDDKRKVREEKLYPHNIAAIFSRVSDATVRALGRDPVSHPRHYILTKMRVSPTTIRPDVRKMGSGGRSNNDELTSMLRVIVTRNDAIDAVLPPVIDHTTERAIWDLTNACYDLVRAGGEGAMASLAERLKGKHGRFRQTQMGKRVRNMCRSTITGDPSLRIDEVGVPIHFAKTVQIEETVQEYNRARLLTYITNGRARYPGCTKVRRIATGSEYGVDSMSGLELENGDVVFRDLINGDPVCFNRQPSLMASNITMMRVVITEDPRILTLRMNVIVTPYFNADFDGDAMNLIISSSVAARNEVTELSNAAQWFVSHKSGGPALGQVEDSVVGMADLTSEGCEFDRYHAALIFSNTTFVPDLAAAFGDAPRLTGRDLVSLSLIDAPINYTRVPTFYQADKAPYMKYAASDIHVEISQGRHISGVLDKRSIGKGAIGGIYDMIAVEYGARRSLDVMFNHQQMAIATTLLIGRTIGLRDMLVTRSAKAEIDRIAGDIINKSKLITDKLNNGEIIPPIGTTVEEFYEAQQIEALRVLGDFESPILRGIDLTTNNLFRLVIYGSKGQFDNIYNMMSAVGQKLINNERIRQKFGHRRTLAYFSRFDTDPESRGYIPDSYLGGLTSPGYVFNAMAARFDIISKALSTSITGEQNRKSVKNLESIVVNNYRWCTKKQNIIQLVYGENGLDPRRTEIVKFVTVSQSDAEFAAWYGRGADGELTDPTLLQFADSSVASVKSLLDAEWAAAQRDRAQFREIFIRVESINVKHFFTDSVRIHVNVERVYRDTLAGTGGPVKLTAEQFADNLRAVVDLCAALPYLMINEIQERAGTAVPDFLRAATWLAAMAVRTYLNGRAVAVVSPRALRVIIDKIRVRYIRALIEPGSAVGIFAAASISEPLTQYTIDAHHRSASGGTSKGGMIRAKEVLGARDVDKLASPTMFIVLADTAEGPVSEGRAREIANNIEAMRVSQFVVSWHIFFERFGAPEHPTWAAEADDIEGWLRHNPLLTPPGDLVRWCVRLLLDKTTLILKNMSLDLIVTRLRELFPETFIVYTNENAPQCWIRVYMRGSMFKDTVGVKEVRGINDAILNSVIRGVDEITYTTIYAKPGTEIAADGSLTKRRDHIITTNGTNLRGLFVNRYVNPLRVTSDAIREVERMLGIEAARQTIIKELRGVVDGIYHSHYTIYADEMTYNGRVTSIERSGLSTRESSNILLRVGFASPIQTLQEAAIHAAEDEISGMTAPLLIGSTPRTGTLFNRVAMNPDFIRENVRRPDDVLDDL